MSDVKTAYELQSNSVSEETTAYVMELEAEVEKLKDILDDTVEGGMRLAEEHQRLLEYDRLLTEIMPKDYKSWHENSREEWPLVASLTIKGLQEREEWALEELKRTQAEVERLGRLLDKPAAGRG